jgi:hypothetical protein
MPQFTDRNPAPEDDHVLSFRAWCRLNNFSEATGLRLRRAGKGPSFVRISDRRLGVTVGENRRWREARALPAT